MWKYCNITALTSMQPSLFVLQPSQTHSSISIFQGTSLICLPYKTFCFSDWQMKKKLNCFPTKKGPNMKNEPLFHYCLVVSVHIYVNKWSTPSSLQLKASHPPTFEQQQQLNCWCKLVFCKLIFSDAYFVKTRWKRKLFAFFFFSFSSKK